MIRSTALRLALCLAAGATLAFTCQRVLEESFPGDYPAISPPLTGEYVYTEDSVRIALSAIPKSGRVLVFGYDEAGDMMAILKPVYDGAVELRRGDLADLVVHTRGSEIEGFTFLKRMDRYTRKVDMLQRLVDSRDHGLRFGVQRCLYPICTRCTDGCRSVISGGDLPITMEITAGGQIMPVFSKGKCPRCGKCFTWCASGVVVKAPARGR